jgi:hypothetical protein
MKYSEFISTLNRQDWTAFSGVHFIIPPSLCEEITYVQTPFYHTFTSVQTIRRSSTYGFQDFKKRQAFYNNLLKLEENIKLIPSSTEMRNHARKIPLLHTLDRIANDITLTARPSSYFHIPPNRTISSYKRGDHVFKRTHSAAFRHVIIPDGSPSGVDDDSVLDLKFDFEDEPRWFIQDVVPSLKRIECRVGICLQRPDKKVIFRKWTSKSAGFGPEDGLVMDCNDVDALIDIGTLA